MLAKNWEKPYAAREVLKYDDDNDERRPDIFWRYAQLFKPNKIPQKNKSLGNITWSEMGQQNVQAEEVYLRP